MLLKIFGIHSFIVGDLRVRYSHEPPQFLGQQTLMYIMKTEEVSLTIHPICDWYSIYDIFV